MSGDSGYTKTTVIDCARSQSEEAINYNNEQTAQWTNKAGDGVRVKAGDTLRCHSAYISELGAEAGEIQIKGINLGVSADVEVTEEKYAIFDYDCPTKYIYQSASNVVQSVDIRDDTFNLVVSPYKSANGENYFFLPRRYTAEGWSGALPMSNNVFDVNDGTEPAEPTGATRYAIRPLAQCPIDRQKVYPPGSVATSKVAGFNDGKRYTLFKRNETFMETPSSQTYTITGKAIINTKIIKITNGADVSSLIVGMKLDEQSDEVFPTASADQAVISSIDLTTNEISLTVGTAATSTTTTFDTWGFSYTSTIDLLPSISPDNVAADIIYRQGLRDPAVLGNYHQIRNLISIPVNPGFNSPSDVAVQLTEELNARNDFQEYTYETENTAQTVQIAQRVTFKSESPCYKLYNCATATNFSKAFFDEWQQVKYTVSPGTPLADVTKSLKYLSSYQHIGVKRPEFFIAGHALNASLGFSTSGDRVTESTDEVFNTGIEWSEANLQKFADFFEAQSKDPELWTDYTQNGIGVNPTDTRFIHMNIYDNGPVDPLSATNPSAADMKIYEGPGLGYDLYSRTINASHTSFPLFVDFNPDTVNLSAADAQPTIWSAILSGGTATSDYNQLAHGFGRRIYNNPLVGGGDTPTYIGFQFTRTLNYAPVHFFEANSEQGGNLQLGVAGPRNFGYDYHFSSYGNMCIGLTNGNQDTHGTSYNQGSTEEIYFNSIHGERLIPMDPFKFGIYCGADSPTISYDSQQQRFQLADFHTSEVVGNVDDAGKQATTTAGQPVPDGGLSAAARCYKINKVMLKNNYTPEMTPYAATFNASTTTPSGSLTAPYTKINVNIKPWTIMDAESGLFIEDWVIPERNWNDSLVGIMGYRYNQFHNDDLTISRQVRIKSIGEACPQQGNIITTNADVNEGDLIGYSKNIYAASTYQTTNVIPYKGNFHNTAQNAAQLYPAITITPATSIQITAEALPTKMLRPYYTIRSDIILENNYIGGNKSGITLPIVCVVDKSNGYGDFYTQQGPTQLTFTNTLDRVITSIRTSIHEPDGSYARVDNNSAVIYRIDSHVDADLNLVDTLLLSKKKKDQKIAQYVESLSGLPV